MKGKQIMFILAVVVGVSLLSCGGPRRVSSADSEQIASVEPAPWDLIEDSDYLHGNPLPKADAVEETTQVDTTPVVFPEDLADRESEAVDTVGVEPMGGARLGRYNRIGNLHEVFNDSNKYQYAAAEKIGIRPIHTLADAYYINRPMQEIVSCSLYDVDTLKHSMPYLVPEAARLLETIGRNFEDSLRRRNAPGHRFRVTSLLRTSHSVKKLRRVNGNATDSSTHKFGTTFDISYSHFNYYGKGARLSDEELKYILAEVLRDLRQQRKCMVKFERKTPCFHITATGR